MFYKKFVATLILFCLTLTLFCATGLALDDPGREDEVFLTYYKVIESYEVCHENGVPYGDSENPEERLVKFEDGRYIVHFALRSEDCNILGTRRLAREEMLEPIIDARCTEPKIETVVVTNHWRWKDNLEENAMTEEVKYRLTLPLHSITLSE